MLNTVDTIDKPAKLLDKILMTRYDAETYERLAATAAEQNLSRAAVVRLALTQHLSKLKTPVS